jgi:hypothetical protein
MKICAAFDPSYDPSPRFREAEGTLTLSSPIGMGEGVKTRSEFEGRLTARFSWTWLK